MMCFNDIFIIRDLTRCDNSLRIAAGLSVSQGYSSTIAHMLCPPAEWAGEGFVLTDQWGDIFAWDQGSMAFPLLI